MTRVEALARHPVAIVGALITTISAVVFCALLIGMFAGLFGRNPYAGLVVFVAIPAVFVAGLLLVPLGMYLQRRKQRRHPELAVEEWPVVDFRRVRVRRTALVIAALTAVNVVIVLLAGYGTLHWMESPSFCGQACHVPMQPQFAAWRGASHGRIACVDCHIAEGATGFAEAKLSGVRQLVQVAAQSYPRPIPPGAKMSPGRQAGTCINCHRPEHDVGSRIRVIREYADDETHSETMTVLQMYVGASAYSKRAIHWHANPSVRIEYVSTDPQRETIPYVRVTDGKGQVKEYRTKDATEEMIRGGNQRIMDCIDCHNTVGHPISPSAEQAVDRAIAAGRMSRNLPYARREGVRLLKATHSTQEAGVDAIARELRAFYGSRGGHTDDKALEQTVAALQDLYRRNVFPNMNVTWGAYPNNKGHLTATGCFRCHDDLHAARDGSTISGDCEYCHTQIETPN